MEKNDWREELQEIIEEEETDMERPMIPRYAKGYAKLVLENFISSVIEKERKKLVSDINDALKDSIKNNESVSKVIEKIDIKVFDIDESSTIRIDMVNMVNSELDKAREDKIQNIFTREEWGLMYESLIYRFGNDKGFKHLEQKILGMRKLSKLKDNK